MLPEIDVNDGKLRFTLSENMSGVTLVNVTLMDNGGMTNGGVNTSPVQQFSIAINFVNEAPSFLVGSNIDIQEDSGAQVFNAWATSINQGLNDPNQNLTFVITTDNDALFDGLPTVNPENGNLSVIPDDDMFGMATVSISLMDDGGTDNGGINTSSIQQFTINVQAVNDAPSFVVGPNINVNEDSGQTTINNWASSISAGNNESTQGLSFNVVTITLLPASGVSTLFSQEPFIDSVNGNLSFTIIPEMSGTAKLLINLTDDGGIKNGGEDASLVQEVFLTINSVNDAPSFNIIGDVELDLFDLSDNPTLLNGFISDFDLGPSNEANQEILQYNVSIQSDSNGILNNVSVNNEGVLSLDLTSNTGVALMEINLQDDGGVDNGGQDTSANQPFFISIINDIIFIDSFEDPNTNMILKYLEKFENNVIANEIPFFNTDFNAVSFYGELYYLNDDQSTYIRFESFINWLKEVLIFNDSQGDYDADGLNNIDDIQPFD